MKKIFVLLIFLSSFNLFNENNHLNYMHLAKKHSTALKDINLTANVLFAKILALEIGRQFSRSNNVLTQDLILYSSKLRQQIENVSRHFTKDFGLN